MSHTHVYRTDLAWSGTTAVGYDAYERSHRLTAVPTPRPGADAATPPATRASPPNEVSPAAGPAPVTAVSPATGPPALELSSDPAFRGDPGRLNPEQMLLAAASSCQLLSFLAVAARARLDVVGYTDAAEAEMPEDDKPMRIVRITLRPVITLGPLSPEVTDHRLDHLVALAHRECFIANSLRSEMAIEQTYIRT